MMEQQEKYLRIMLNDFLIVRKVLLISAEKQNI